MGAASWSLNEAIAPLSFSVSMRQRGFLMDELVFMDVLINLARRLRLSILSRSTVLLAFDEAAVVRLAWSLDEVVGSSIASSTSAESSFSSI